jgi:hypothetical protein
MLHSRVNFIPPGKVFNLKRTRLIIILLSVFLYAGQFASQVHASVHPFHTKHYSYCLTLSALAHASHALLTHTAQIPSVFTTSIASTSTLIILQTIAPTHYRARAPPSLS